MLGNTLFARLALPSGQHACRSSTCACSFASCCQLRLSRPCRFGIVPEGSRKTVSKCRLKCARTTETKVARPIRNCTCIPDCFPIASLGSGCALPPSTAHTLRKPEGGTSDVRLHIHPRLLPHCFAWVRLRTAAIKTPWPSDLGAGRCKQGWGRARLRSPCRILSSWPRRQPWQLQRASDHLRRHLKAELACGPCCSLQLQCGTRALQAHVV